MALLVIKRGGQKSRGVRTIAAAPSKMALYSTCKFLARHRAFAARQVTASYKVSEGVGHSS